jgi:hypothetical protein
MGNVCGHGDQHFGPRRVRVLEAPTFDDESRRRGEGATLGLSCWKRWTIRDNQASDFPGGRAGTELQAEEKEENKENRG